MSTAVANRVLLVSIDGWGLTDSTAGNAIYAANTPVMDTLMNSSLSCRIDASGLSVGLPAGNMGNSEVGHLTMGAGRVEFQDLVRINKSIEDGEFEKNGYLQQCVEHVKQANGRIHLLGLVSDGGVHSHINHLFALIKALKHIGVKECFIHAITDGRDTAPTSATIYLQQLIDFLNQQQYGELVSVCGRYYAMDRDKRWERVLNAYQMLVDGKGDDIEKIDKEQIIDVIKQRYARNENDEFIKPIVLSDKGLIQDNDTLLFFNYRSDRMREIVSSFAKVKKQFDKTVTTRENLHVVQMTQYDPAMILPTLFPPQSMTNSLAEWLSKQGLRQFHTAETEKYAHVTFFFAGGIEVKYEGEDREMVPSPKVPTYDLQPEMNQQGVADSVCSAIDSGKYDFVLCNLAAPDMVGHTGVYDAAVVACTKCDAVIGQLLQRCQDKGWTLIVTADHGNAEEMLDEHGKPKTSHTTNLIPFLISTPDQCIQFTQHIQQHLQNDKAHCVGGLSDVAPTVLTVMGLSVPQEMTGKSLIQREQ